MLRCSTVRMGRSTGAAGLALARGRSGGRRQGGWYGCCARAPSSRQEDLGVDGAVGEWSRFWNVTAQSFCKNGLPRSFSHVARLDGEAGDAGGWCRRRALVSPSPQRPPPATPPRRLTGQWLAARPRSRESRFVVLELGLTELCDLTMRLHPPDNLTMQDRRAGGCLQLSSPSRLLSNLHCMHQEPHFTPHTRLVAVPAQSTP